MRPNGIPKGSPGRLKRLPGRSGTPLRDDMSANSVKRLPRPPFWKIVGSFSVRVRLFLLEYD